MNDRNKKRLKLALVMAFLLGLSFFIQNGNDVVPLSPEIAAKDGGSEEVISKIQEDREKIEEIEDEEKEEQINEEDEEEEIEDEEKEEKKEQEKAEKETKVNKSPKTKKEKLVAEAEKKYSKEDITKIKEEQKKEKEKIIASDSKKPKDKYLTDPVPAGKPKPVEWQDVKIDKSKKRTATLSVTCHSIHNNMHLFNMDKIDVLPEDGIIYATKEVTFYEGESVFNVLLREMQNAGIHMEFEMTPIYNSHYIQGINNLYEFDCGELSGWMYRVNGWFPNYGASRYMLKDGDKIEWIYTCDLGRDIGGGAAVLGGE